MSFQRILVPVDFSECSREALRVACDLARASGGELHILNAYGLSKSDYPYVAYLTHEVERQVVESALEQVAEWKARHVPADLSAVTHTSPKEARVAILEVADTLGADVIVMGTHGRSGLKRLALGSVADHVVRTARCPVLMVRPPAAASEG